ncbi:MAG: hypothetical protein IMW89_06910 [Ktedonobacteraceae bacterium]|nr:hypothetical protein [Ktedonobacteraceae bacterium]
MSKSNKKRKSRGSQADLPATSRQDVDTLARQMGTTRARAARQAAEEGRPVNYYATQGAGKTREAAEQSEQSEIDYGIPRDTCAEEEAERPDEQGVIRAEEGYDPAQSGVRQSHKQPGKKAEAPGRESGTDWGEQLEMGLTTDTPENRRNPAN